MAVAALFWIGCVASSPLLLGEASPPSSIRSEPEDRGPAPRRDVAGRTTPPDRQGADGIWISKARLLKLPMRGKAWKRLLAAAEAPHPRPDLADQNDKTNVLTLARALVAVRTEDERMAEQVRAAVMSAIGTERGGRTLALGRNLAAFVIAADLVGLSGKQDERFRTWLRTALSEKLDGQTLCETHERRPNNWGTMAGASRAAAAVYLGDERELKRTARIFQGWLGDRAAYAGFEYKRSLSWHADPGRPLGINPRGAIVDGHNVDGALPDDMRRGGPFTWPPQPTGYPWGALQGAVVQAEILSRQRFDAWEWSDRALLRAVEFLHRIEWDAEGDDEWIPWLIDARYGTRFAENPRARPGKVIGWTSWTHSGEH